MTRDDSSSFPDLTKRQLTGLLMAGISALAGMTTLVFGAAYGIYLLVTR